MSDAFADGAELPGGYAATTPPKASSSSGDGVFTRSGKIKLLKLEDLDKRTNAAKAAFEFRDALADERGGVEQLGVLKSAMLDSVAVLSAGIRHLETLWLSGKPVDMTELATLLNARRREALIVGVDPAPKDNAPTLHAYVHHKTSSASDAEEPDDVASS